MTPADLHALQRAHQPRVGATNAAQRIAKLRKLHDTVMARRDEIRAAMWADYQKPAAEVDLSEIYPVVGEARHAMRHLRKWLRPQRVSTRLALMGARSYVRHEPKGVVLILSPWNFPFNLSLGPLISAVAAGNCVILKPSEMTPHSAACMKKLLAEVFEESEVAVVEGDAKVAEELLRMPWDHVFFTGSPAVGKLVMKAAAEHLTSVTLELGGKSPVVIDRTADLDEAAQKVAWGKFFNCGQICIAPDYLLVDESIRQPFLEKLRASIDKLGDQSRGLIVNDRHASRVKRLFDSAVAGGAKVWTGGGIDGRRVKPTVLTDVAPDSPVMQEEIFGPILPVMTYRDREEAYRFINEREKPLVLYVFSRDRRVAQEVIARTSAGGTVVNDTLIHFFEMSLPFGGVGNSGIGRGHGRWGFEAFSNPRGVLDQKLKRTGLQLMYPPYGGKVKEWLIDFTMKWL
ncbi:MAG TPA: aldehyde dehydrogenase family protein [Thermoanaerobaculia bacterium]